MNSVGQGLLRRGDEGVSTYPAGWYPDSIPGQQRYWDGEQWTQYVTAATIEGGGGWRLSAWSCEVSAPPRSW